MSEPSGAQATDPALEDAISSIKATHEDETPRGVDADADAAVDSDTAIHSDTSGTADDPHGGDRG